VCIMVILSLLLITLVSLFVVEISGLWVAKRVVNRDVGN
jgi:uncharacterized protein YneF (UPF0154 family)